MSRSGWNFASHWAMVSDAKPTQTALFFDERPTTWRRFDARASALASSLRAAGVRAGDKIAIALYNSPYVLEAYYAAFKIGAVPANTNYRYQADELHYIWDNCDASVVFFDAKMVDRVETVRRRLPAVRLWVSQGESVAPVADWATPYQVVVHDGDPHDVAPHERGGDDIFLLYTGGTTGKPKGVMWRQDDFFTAIHRQQYSSNAQRRLIDSAGRTPPVSLPAAPLMHGGGLVVSWGALDLGGSVVLSSSRSFDPDKVLDLVARHRVSTLGIIGDAFAAPLVDAIERRPEVPDLSSLRMITSGGAMWSVRNKQRLLEVARNGRLVDALGASEALNVARSVASADRPADATGTFRISDDAVVVDDDGRDVVAGSGAVGRLAISGPTSLGYYKDAEASQSRILERDGARLTLTGDYATVAADGSVRFLGRGNLCINTGGEKVFPEEVEEVIKSIPGVTDAAVIGVSDDILGEAVCAVLECDAVVTDDVVLASVKAVLAGYKAPKLIVRGAVPRLANGKVDYPALKARARAGVHTERVGTSHHR